MTFDSPIPFTEAIEKLRGRGVLPAGWDSEQWRRVPTGIRERAFFSARVESARVLTRMQDYLSDYLAEDRALESHGGLRAQGRAEFVANMRELAIREGLGVVDPETGEIDPVIREGNLQDIRSVARLELIFDTQTEAAQEYGYWQQGQDPDVLEVWPAQRFIRVRPVAAPRPYHEAALGEVRRKDDLEFWVGLNRDFGVPWGPWGFNSGCGVEDVDRDEAVELRVMAEEEEVRPVEREFNEGLQAGVRDISPDILAALERSTGGQAADGVLRPREFPQALLSDPDGEGALELPDEILEDLLALETREVWGTAQPLAGLSRANRRRLLQDERRRLRGAKLEESALVTEAGVYHERTGGERSVPWPDDLLPGAVMTHTHPQGGTLGPEDVSLLLERGMAGVRAVTTDRVFSATAGRRRLELPQGGDLVRDTAPGRQAKREAVAVMQRMLGERGSPLERAQLITRLAWARLHQQGFIRYKEEKR